MDFLAVVDQAIALLRQRGRLYVRTGQWQHACAALAAAIDLYRDMDMTFWLPQAEAALGQVESVP